MHKADSITYKFNSHKNHNPSCDILECHFSQDSFVTYGQMLHSSTTFVEYYSGENYKHSSKKRSYSRVYYLDRDKLPKWIEPMLPNLIKKFNEHLKKS